MQVQFNKKTLMVVAALCLGFQGAFAQQESDSRSREEIRAILQKCFESAGMEKPEKGQRPVAPTEEQRTLVDACLRENNVQPPAHRGGGHPPQREAASVQ